MVIKQEEKGWKSRNTEKIFFFCAKTAISFHLIYCVSSHCNFTANKTENDAHQNRKSFLWLLLFLIHTIFIWFFLLFALIFPFLPLFQCVFILLFLWSHFGCIKYHFILNLFMSFLSLSMPRMFCWFVRWLRISLFFFFVTCFSECMPYWAITATILAKVIHSYVDACNMMAVVLKKRL